ncbi:hypothetical protein GDO78_006585 [Eleutherodactylus coqui]|uniref:Uncharacterized protein n=1 Tax=Eleutherodactylus coqui TaxID=57060 RepID=A0A8J6FDW9_ELECQ|nr:hypothetical protein GDO78_006585 [Eleutherodactylus coqui]
MCFVFSHVRRPTESLDLVSSTTELLPSPISNTFWMEISHVLLQIISLLPSNTRHRSEISVYCTHREAGIISLVKCSFCRGRRPCTLLWTPPPPKYIHQ